MTTIDRKPHEACGTIGGLSPRRLRGVSFTSFAFSIVGAIGAMLPQRYVIIIATSFSGAWTIVVGGLAIAGAAAVTRAAVTGNVWILYPFTAVPGQRWVPLAWLVLGLIGTGVQLGMTGRKKR